MSKNANLEIPQLYILGRKSTGKSSLINSLVKQEFTVGNKNDGVSTDAFNNSVEIFPYGPVDIEEIELLEDAKLETIGKPFAEIPDFALVVLESSKSLSDTEKEIIGYLERLNIKFFIAVNKIELGTNQDLLNELKELNVVHFEVSCSELAGLQNLKDQLIKQILHRKKCPLSKNISAK